MKRWMLIFSVLVLFILVGCEKDDSITMKLNPGIDTIEIHSIYTDPMVTATYKGSSVTVTASTSIDTSQLGTQEIVYTAQAQAGNTTIQATIRRIVTVVDETTPVLTLNAGLDTIYVGEDWTDAGVSALDNSLGNVTITTQGTVNKNVAGPYTITYIGTDPSGNQASIIRIVHVLTKP